jgi:16S rRNA (cytosine967-C5)-methyltransferase
MNLSSLVGHLLELLRLTEKTSKPIDRVIAEFFRTRSYLGSHDRRFVAEKYYAIVRHRRYLEALLEQCAADLPHGGFLDHLPERYVVLYLFSELRLMSDLPVDQILPMSLWKTSFPSIDLSSVVEWWKIHSSLDFLGADPIVSLGVKYSFQDWMVAEWLSALGTETDRLLEAMNRQAPVTLRVNLLKCTVEECRARLQEEGIASERTVLSPVGLVLAKRFAAQSSPAFRDGWFEIQDEGSQLISVVANPQPGSLLIDACAGAGGKSLHLAELMGNRGEIVAVDIDRRKLSELETRARRAGVTNIRTIASGDLDPMQFQNTADCILVDAPCSGSGTIRRNPGIKWRLTESSIEEFHKLQSVLLGTYAGCVKVGGKLLYSTCSLFRRENEAVIAEFISMHKQFQLLPISGVCRAPEDPGNGIGCTLYPQRWGTDGFYLALLERTG